MNTFGENLRREREMRGISLQEIAQATKISARMFEAIETGRFELLPGGVFNRAFVRQYARYLGLDEDPVVADFDAACAPLAEPPSPSRKAAEATEAGPASNLALWIAVGLVALAALSVGGWRWLAREAPKAPRVRPPVQAVAPAPAKPQPPVAPPPADPVPKVQDVEVDAQSLELRVDSSERTTFSVSRDGEPAWTASLDPGRYRTIRAAATIELETEDAGPLLLTLNGQAQPPLGAKGENKKITYRVKGAQP